LASHKAFVLASYEQYPKFSQGLNAAFAVTVEVCLMKGPKITNRTEAGFSLIELTIVCAILAILAAVSIASMANRDDAQRFAQDVAARLRERRASAIRINALTQPTLIENFRQPPISIDFGTLSTTAPLVTEGTSATTFSAPAQQGATGTWNFVYQGQPLTIPTGWRIAASASQLSPIPLISLGTPTTLFAFTPDGRLDPSSLPAASANTNPNVESPFPAIYLTNGTSARAIVVHPSGLIEPWIYDQTTGTWRGFGNRVITS
jgi:prepilin-type N-terminal cleavage/methylation domain-containing protein